MTPRDRRPVGQVPLGWGAWTCTSSRPGQHPDQAPVGAGNNTDGAGQKRNGSATRGHTITFGVSIQNDGTHADRFAVQATGRTVSGYRVKYRYGSKDITAAVVAGTYQTISLAPGAKYLITATVTVQLGAAAGSSVARLVTLKSVRDSVKQDAVTFIGRRM